MIREPGMVSVVVSSWNRAPYLRECLDSLRAQTYGKLEILVVDDGSEDGSVRVVRQWVREWRRELRADPAVDAASGGGAEPPVVVVPLPRNIGFAGAVTVGLFHARGEFIAMQDGDDYSLPLRLERQVAHLQAHPELDLVGSNYLHFREGDSPRSFTAAAWLRYGEQEIRAVYWNGGHCVCHGTVMFRAAVFDRLGGLSRRIPGAEDYEFIAKFLNAKCRIDNLPEPLYVYRVHEGQRSTAYFGKKG